MEERGTGLTVQFICLPYSKSLDHLVN